jgi:hypothetical protein
MKPVPVLLPAIILSVVLTTNPQLISAQNLDALTSMDRKLQHVESNGKLAHPDPAPTMFTKQEINAYLASQAMKFPPGVQSVFFQEQPGMVNASTRVDFDRLKAGVDSSNPLLSIFTGVHDVVVVAHAHGAGGQGLVQVDSVSLDGVEIPRFVVQLFVEKYLRPRYPQVGLESQFNLPSKIDTALVGFHTVIVRQK